MSNKFSDAQEVSALSLDNKVGLFAGDGTPDLEVLGAPIGSKYFRTNGERYDKTGLGDLLIDWTLDSGSGAVAGVGIELVIIGW